MMRLLGVVFALVALSIGCGKKAGGGDLVTEAEQKAKAACECKDAECVRQYIKWFNEKSLRDDGAAVKALPADKQEQYTSFALQAGDCQVKLQTGTP